MLVSYTAPYKAVSRNSISQWLRTILEESGIDLDIFFCEIFHVILSFLSNYFPIDCFPLNVLSYKCVVLLVLAIVQRVQTLPAINVIAMFFE